MMQPLRVVEANARVYRRTWKGSAVTAFLNPVLFLLALGLGLGSTIDSNPAVEGLGGVRYISFVASGLLAATAMQTGGVEGSWPVLAGIKWTKTYHAALATPVRVPDLVTGNLLWLAVRVTLSATAFALVSAVIGVLDPIQVLAALPAAILTGMAFAAPVTAYTPVAKDETRLSAVFRFVILPMFLFSGTFFPIDQLPGWLQPVAYVTPLWHGVELCRSSAIGFDTTLHPIVHVGYLALWTSIGWWFAQRNLRKRLQP
jgi:lipooligosaccharide transport system permease protein